MNNDGMAKYISELRKSKNMTQKQLAEKLSITDKAVSKWERGLGYPDITTLPLLAEILGVTVDELLNGKQEDNQTPKAEILVQNTLQYAQKVSITKEKNSRSIAKFVITTSFVLATVVCLICDLAVSWGLSWSLYVMSSVAFTWVILMPLFHFEKKAGTKSLISLSVFIVPFLYFIEQLVVGNWLFPLGIPISAVSLTYLWTVWGIFARTKINRWYATCLAFGAVAPLSVAVKFIVSKFTGEQLFDVWNTISIGILFVIAVILFIIGYFNKRKM